MFYHLKIDEKSSILRLSVFMIMLSIIYAIFLYFCGG